MTPDPTPDLTVVVPTRDRPDSLAACLADLARQSNVAIEVVVVDDASADGHAVARVVDEAGVGARLMRGAGDGPAAARNLGARHAAAPVIAFTDDDCRPCVDWASTLVAAVADGADAVAGPTVNGRPSDPFAEAAQTVTNHLTESGLDATATSTTFAPSSNLAVRAGVFAELPFDESFPLAAGEDRAWCDRLVGSGRRLAYAPGAVVHHHPDLGWRGFWRQQERYGRGARHLRASTDSGGLRHPGFYVGLLRKGLRRGPRVGALVAIAQVATATGIVRETLARHPR